MVKRLAPSPPQGENPSKFSSTLMPGTRPSMGSLNLSEISAVNTSNVSNRCSQIDLNDSGALRRSYRIAARDFSGIDRSLTDIDIPNEVPKCKPKKRRSKSSDSFEWPTDPKPTENEQRLDAYVGRILDRNISDDDNSDSSTSSVTSQKSSASSKSAKSTSSRKSSTTETTSAVSSRTRNSKLKVISQKIFKKALSKISKSKTPEDTQNLLDDSSEDGEEESPANVEEESQANVEKESQANVEEESQANVEEESQANYAVIT
jgi:hypothetical protein